jgi:hypothetical protein
VVISLNIAASWIMVGLIWLVQYTVYPAFRVVPEDRFPAYHQHHTSSISWIILPFMLSEAGLTLWLVFSQAGSWSSLVVLGLLAVIWLSTFLVQVPIHQQLASGKDLRLIDRLVSSNWIRTILWTAKAIWISYGQLTWW